MTPGVYLDTDDLFIYQDDEGSYGWVLTLGNAFRGETTDEYIFRLPLVIPEEFL